jgi:hypothetical protein
MGIKKTLLIWATSLSTAFGAAAGNPQTGKSPFSAATEMATKTTEEKRVDFKPGVEKELRNSAAAMVIKLGLHLQFKLAKQMMGMEDVLYYGLPVPVWNRIVTALNDNGDRAKIVQALTNVVSGALSDDKGQVKKCKEIINSWQTNPLGFAKFLGDATGKDFVNPPQTTQPTNQPK